jgi:hypothetical protein
VSGETGTYQISYKKYIPDLEVTTRWDMMGQEYPEYADAQVNTLNTDEYGRATTIEVIPDVNAPYEGDPAYSGHARVSVQVVMHRFNTFDEQYPEITSITTPTVYYQ